MSIPKTERGLRLDLLMNRISAGGQEIRRRERRNRGGLLKIPLFHISEIKIHSLLLLLLMKMEKRGLLLQLMSLKLRQRSFSGQIWPPLDDLRDRVGKNPVELRRVLCLWVAGGERSRRESTAAPVEIRTTAGESRRHLFRGEGETNPNSLPSSSIVTQTHSHTKLKNKTRTRTGLR